MPRYINGVRAWTTGEDLKSQRGEILGIQRGKCRKPKGSTSETTVGVVGSRRRGGEVNKVLRGILGVYIFLGTLGIRKNKGKEG